MEKKHRNVLIVAVVIASITTTGIFVIQFYSFGPLIVPPPDYDSLPSAPILYDIQPDPDPDVNIDLSWSASTRVWYYNVYRRESLGVEIQIKSETARNSYTDSTPKEEGKYYYRIEAVNNIGEVTSNKESVTINFLVEPLPDPPVEPILNMITGPSDTGEIYISWSSVSDADDYAVYRSDDDDSYDNLGIVDTNSYDDSIAEDGTYYYKVKAGNDVGYSDFSNVESVVVAIPGVPGVPDVPEAYFITYEIVDSEVEITVSWGSVSCDSYNLYKEIITETKSTGFVLIEEGLTSTSYSEVLTEVGKYTYKVSAVNDIGESDQSNPTSVNITDEGVDEPLDDDYTWLYVLLGVLCVAVVPVVILTRKKKKNER